MSVIPFPKLAATDPLHELIRQTRGWRRKAFGLLGTPGEAPGMIRLHPESPPPRLYAFIYGEGGLRETEVTDAAAVRASLAEGEMLWLNVDGLGDPEAIEAIGRAFGLHRLSLEDVVNTNQRPKIEAFDDHTFVVLRMLSPTAHADVEQMSLVFGDNWVVTFQEHAGDYLDPVRERLRRPSGRIRVLGADYLAYALMDAIVDRFFPFIDRLDEALESNEDEIFSRPTEKTMARIHLLKRQVRMVRHGMLPLRIELERATTGEHQVFGQETRPYIRDLIDHIARGVELVETLESYASDLMSLYHSAVSHRMNEIMKVLTILAAIFVPITFVAGIYGMNFDPEASPLNMPELSWYFGYPYALGLMAAIAVVLIVWFRRKGWV